MANIFTGFLATFLFLSPACGSKMTNPEGKATPLIPKDTTSLKERKNTLFVFVGEKMKITPIPYEPGDFDYGIRATYRILERVYGYYDKDTIEFEAYDHFGTPVFVQYRHALLYVSEYKGKFYQEKYMFDPVYKTRDGRWAGLYSSEYDHAYNENTTVKPQRIKFVEEVSFPLKRVTGDGKEIMLDPEEITRRYPKPYFKVVGNKAVAVYGNYIEDLFKLSKEGVLTARGLFGQN